MGERLQHDAATLLDRAAFDGEQIASASVAADVNFASEADRTGFLEEYLQTLTHLVERYGAKEGTPYRVLLAAYPNHERREQ